MAITPAEFNEIQARARAAFQDALGDGNFAVANPTTADQGQRFVRDSLRNMVGGPVDQAVLLAAIAGDEVDTAALVAELLPGLVSGLGSQVTLALQPLIDEGVLTASEVATATEAALRNVLGGLDN
jgi:hypothetical protein